MAINTKDVQTGGGVSKTLQPGNRLVKVTSLYLEKFPFKDDAYHLVIEGEGPAMGGDFEGFFIDKDDESKGRHAGQVGRIKASEWAYADATIPGGTEIKRDDEMVKFLKNLCDATGASAWFISEDGKHDTIEALVHKMNTDKPFADKFMQCCLAGREYENKGGYLNYDLYFPKFTRTGIPFAAETNDAANIIQYNPDTHIKRKQIKEVDSFGGDTSDASADFEMPAE